MKTPLITLLLLASLAFPVLSQKKDAIEVIAYYSAGPNEVANIDPKKMTDIIYSFGHLKGNRFAIDNARDSLTLKKLVALKKQNPALRVHVSLGGWGGCAPCSEIFSTEANRQVFAQSVKDNLVYFGADGIDLDWEYPSIPGHPGHRYAPEDKPNFTSLVEQLRAVLGKKSKITFAAGGFQRFLDESVDWKSVMAVVDQVNLMTYDLVHGFSTTTGHHTPLYSTPEQHESTDNAVQWLINHGVPRKKLVIGAAFYGRMWENVAATNNGRYQTGKFKRSTNYKDLEKVLSPDKGFAYYWDDVAKAPYFYNASQQLYFTFENPRSIETKTKYAIDQKLGGIMFWDLTADQNTGGLLDAIGRVRNQ